MLSGKLVLQLVVAGDHHPHPGTATLAVGGKDVVAVLVLPELLATPAPALQLVRFFLGQEFTEKANQPLGQSLDDSVHVVSPEPGRLKNAQGKG